MGFLWALGLSNLAVGLFSLFASLSSYRASLPAARQARPEPPEAPNEKPELDEVCLFAPCAGAEEGLKENLRALLEQDHPNYRTVFIVSDALDRAVPVIQSLLEEYPRASLCFAGVATLEGQKVHKLRRAVRDAGRPDIYAFADSDGRPSSNWLGQLTAHLTKGSSQVELNTGYRFYLPSPGGFPAVVRSVWNVGVLTLLGEHNRNFAWGGAMAIRRSDFERVGNGRFWDGALSDDYALTHAVRRANGKIRFEPRCLVASEGDIGFLELLRWCARQMAITRVYWPALFRIAAVSQIAFSAFLVVGLIALLNGAAALGLLWAVLLLLSWASAALRTIALSRLAPEWAGTLRRYAWAYVLLVPLASLVTVQAAVRALLSRRIEWRGYIYEMLSPNETVIVATPSGKSGSTP